MEGERKNEVEENRLGCMHTEVMQLNCYAINVKWPGTSPSSFYPYTQKRNKIFTEDLLSVIFYGVFVSFICNRC